MAYSAITAGEIDADSPLTTSLVTKLRDNPEAIAGGLAGAPKVQYAGMNFSNNIVAGDIAADAVGASEIAANAVGASEIAANAVGTTELAANAVTPAKLPALVASTDYSITFSGRLSTASLTKEAELIIARSGTVKIRGYLSASYSGKVDLLARTYWRLYKNGVGQGSTYDRLAGSRTDVQDLTVAAGDLIQIYGYTTYPSETIANVEVQVGFTGYLTSATHIV